MTNLYNNDDIEFIKKSINKNYKILLDDFYTPKNIIIQSIISSKNHQINFITSPTSKTYLNIYKGIHKYKIKVKNLSNKIDFKSIKFYKSLLKFNRNTLKKKLAQMYSDNFKHISMFNDAFLKLYEILSQTDIFQPKHKYSTMHFAEAPGGFIYATNTYLKVLNKGKQIEHNWFGNSYNPSGRSLQSILETGRGFDDEYGLMKRHPDRWLFGSSNTGDITDPQVLKDIRTKLSGIKLDLVTGDGGLGHNPNIKEDQYFSNLQKLDFAQMVAVANICTPGSNCIIKIFMNDHDNKYMKEANDLYYGICYMYTLMFEKVKLVKPSMSADSTSEYYIVGQNFVGISDIDREKLLDLLANFQLNMKFIDIPDGITLQLTSFFEELALNITNFNKKLLFLVIYRNQNIRKLLGKDYDKTKAELYFNKEKYNEQIEKFNKYWIDKNKFDLNEISIDI